MSQKDSSVPEKELSSTFRPGNLSERTSPKLNFDRHNFKRYPNSRVTLDSLKQINRLSYPKAHWHDKKLIEGDLSQKLPKITQNDVTRYNLMNDIRLPYQNNDLPIYGPYEDEFSNKISKSEEAKRVQEIKNNYRVINVGGGPEPNFRTMAFSRFHDKPYEFENVEAIDPMNRKYRVKVPRIMDYNQVDYLDKRKYQRDILPYDYDGRGIKLVYAEPINDEYYRTREKNKKRSHKYRKKRRRSRSEKKRYKRLSSTKKKSKSRKRDKSNKYYFFI